MSRRPVRLWLLGGALAAVAASGLAACSSSPTHPSSASTTTHDTHSGGSATSSTAAGGGALIATGTIPAANRSPAGTFGTAPTVTVPPGPPPTTLESADLIVGTGTEAAPGDSVTVQYVLASYSSRQVVQSSWTSNPFTFTLGAGEVIPGWDKGVVGMKVGGRRELIIPPSLAYKSQSPGPGITADDTLVFVIDLTKVG
ncbi:MAG TPA: FKBP-type peptidyl-prolyl cis-trans isomerase [Acidimicrobiales bacterium]|nr:FKBP-type peptidyl-prolyl cis-trans isomerase [Acidimicrobiales bacterium]